MQDEFLEIIHLPAQLFPLKEAMQLNQRLRAGCVRLNWQNVSSSVKQARIALLLKGLNLTDHYEYLGCDTIPQALESIIYQILDTTPQDLDVTLKNARRKGSKVQRADLSHDIPALWTPEDEDEVENDDLTSTRLRHRSILDYEASQAEAPHITIAPLASQPLFDMRLFTNFTTTNISIHLRPLIALYANHDHSVAERLQFAISQISQNWEISNAFSWLNKTMWLQHIHLLYASSMHQKHANEYSLRTLHDFDTPTHRSWHHSQLAFILWHLADPQPHYDLSSILLTPLPTPAIFHFPSVQDSIDAHLGLAVYLLALHILRTPQATMSFTFTWHDQPNGIERQKLQRALTLLCACEIIRRTQPHQWGSEPFRLMLTSAKEGVPLAYCLWCGSGVMRYKGEQGRFYCDALAHQCPFTYTQSAGEGLPLVVRG